MNNCLSRCKFLFVQLQLECVCFSCELKSENRLTEDCIVVGD